MMLLWVLVIFTQFEGGSAADGIQPLFLEQHVLEGADVSLSCNYTGANVVGFQWYHQYLGSSPENLLVVVSEPESRGRLKAEVYKNLKRVDLKISSAAVSDSVLYYCVFGADVIRPSDDQETDVLRTEGEPLTLKCSYETSRNSSSQSISPLEEKVDAVEGQTVTLSCSYEYSGAGTPYLYWYRQSPGSSPEFLLYIYPSGESCVSQSISPLEEKVDAVEGGRVQERDRCGKEAVAVPSGPSP
ncbi:hypothetical protein NFI96_002495 [Prochilodus magdalenae]|nr:hypothetical protein NFI96_002495 [Prochilodus magdalenae]